MSRGESKAVRSDGMIGGRVHLSLNKCDFDNVGQVILPQRYRKDVIFLPQAPYLTYGTLREQLLYPHKDAASTVSDADIIKALKLARLEHIADLVEDFDFTYTLDWTKMLSPGEQQKMAFARLFYARPVFAGKK